jgi:hypothetical protein
MSLPSYICKELPDGSYLGIYCHSSGEVARNGKMLCEHYTDEAKIDKLLALGDISNLAPNLEPDTPNDFSNACYAYCRDGGESYDHNKPQVVRLRNARKSGIKFMYVFGLDGKWRYCNLWQPRSKFQDVQEALHKENTAEM